MLVFGVLAGCSAVCRQTPEGHSQLESLTDRLASFRTVFVMLGTSPEQGARMVLRMDRSSGRITFDHGTDERMSWDGETLWRHRSSETAAAEVGPEANAFLQELVPEIVGGLENTEIFRREQWGIQSSGVRLDLPFAWDDAYALLVTPDTRSDERFGLTTVRRDTLSPVALVPGTQPGSVWMYVDWDVRLFPDLHVRESIESRSRVVFDDGFVQEREGPDFLPGWHEVTTHNPMLLDTEVSLGDPLEEGEPMASYVHLGHVTCADEGRTQRPFELNFRIDPTHASYDFLSDAVAAGCAISVDGRYAHVHEWVEGVRTRVRASVQLLDHSWSGRTSVLAETTFERPEGRNLTPAGSDTWRLVTSATDVTDAHSLRLRVSGFVEVDCPGSVPGDNSVAFRMTEAPVLAWEGCYPELGIVPESLN